MKFNSPVFSQASGSIAGITYSHNKGGQYIRKRASPTNPTSPNQQDVRAAFSTAVWAWRHNLSPVQRADWTLYADNTPMVDRLGMSRPITGQQQYIRTYTATEYARLLGASALTPPSAAPTVFNTGLFTPLSFAIDEITGLSITFANTDGWAIADEGFALISIGQPQNISHRSRPVRFRNVATILGDTMTPPTSPLVIATGALPYTIAATQLVWLRYSIKQPDNRLSTEQYLGPIEVTP